MGESGFEHHIKCVHLCVSHLGWNDVGQAILIMLNHKQVTVVRIYCSEAEHQMEKLMTFLHDEEKVAGVTAFRGIAGFGKNGILHSSKLIDISLDLPIVIEFFDYPEKIEKVMNHLNGIVKPGHMVSWTAMANMGE